MLSLPSLIAITEWALVGAAALGLAAVARRLPRVRARFRDVAWLAVCVQLAVLITVAAQATYRHSLGLGALAPTWVMPMALRTLLSFLTAAVVLAMFPVILGTLAQGRPLLVRLWAALGCWLGCAVLSELSAARALGVGIWVLGIVPLGWLFWTLERALRERLLVFLMPIRRGLSALGRLLLAGLALQHLSILARSLEVPGARALGELVWLIAMVPAAVLAADWGGRVALALTCSQGIVDTPANRARRGAR